jgi:hypothetical protein
MEDAPFFISWLFDYAVGNKDMLMFMLDSENIKQVTNQSILLNVIIRLAFYRCAYCHS